MPLHQSLPAGLSPGEYRLVVTLSLPGAAAGGAAGETSTGAFAVAAPPRGAGGGA